MCDPATLGLGLAASAGGAYLTGQNQGDQAAAANALLASRIGTLNKYGASNEKALGTNVANYAPGAQDTQLANAQTARSNSAAGNISTPVEAGQNDIPVGDAPPAVKSEIAKRMLATHDQATDRAKAMGKLGGYGDTWFENQLRNSQTGGDIATTNNLAEGTKALIPAETKDAALGAYSPVGQYVSGIGSILGSAAGAGGAGSIFGNMSGKLADAGIGNGVGTGGYNFLDAAA